MRDRRPRGGDGRLVLRVEPHPVTEGDVQAGVEEADIGEQLDWGAAEALQDVPVLGLVLRGVNGQRGEPVRP